MDRMASSRFSPEREIYGDGVLDRVSERERERERERETEMER